MKFHLQKPGFLITVSKFLLVLVTLFPQSFCGFLETPEIRYLPPYFGCFHTSLYFEISAELEGTHFIFDSQGISPADCIGFCLRNSTLNFEIATIKGKFCLCARISDRQQDYEPKIQKVPNSFCNLMCPGVLKDRVEPLHSIITINAFCGGNIPYSVYCATDKFNKTGNPINRTPFCDNLWISKSVEEDLYGGDLRELSTTDHNVACAICVNHALLCPTSEIGTPPPLDGAAQTIGFEYSPNNSPLACVNHCRRFLRSTNDFVAILGNLTKTNGRSVNTCFCAKTSDSNLDGFRIVGNGNCGENRSDDGLGKSPIQQYFVVYTFLAGESPTTTDGTSTMPTTFEDTSAVPTTFEYTTTMSTTIETTSTMPRTIETTSTLTTTELAETTSSEQDDTEICEPDPIETSSYPNKNSTVDTTESTMTTEISSDTTLLPEKTTSSRPISTLPPDCEIKCSGNGFYDEPWTGCAGKLATQNCTGKNTTGAATWYCQLNGNFLGLPNYQGCKTGWIDQVKKNLTGEREIYSDEAAQLLHLIKEKCVNASKAEADLDSVYYGHEISEVMNLSVQIMKRLNASEISTYEELNLVISSIVSTVLSYDKVWLYLTPEEISETGEDLLSVVEDSLFILSSKVVEEKLLDDINVDDYHCKHSEAQFKIESGVVMKPNRNEKPLSLTFPKDRKPGESFIDLPPEWLTSDEGDEAQFVAIELNVESATKLFNSGHTDWDGDGVEDWGWSWDGQDSSIVHGNTTVLNSNLMSFSFGTRDNRSVTYFPGRGVQISFEHNRTAWGSAGRPIRRKLYPNEMPKAIQDSADCMFLDIGKEENTWSPEGCRVVESRRERTVCECNHLTSFALLMDIHNYEGKEFWLEVLTWILSSLSAICLLACIVIFSRVKEIQGPRTTLTKNLCVCLLIGIILVVSVMDRNYIYLPDEFCMVTGMLVHYIFLSAFAWMALEGMLLYRMVILVFDTQRHYMNYQRIGAYGLPLVIVAITWAIGEIRGERAYGGDEFCWLEDDYKWGFVGPLAVIISVNLGILFVTLRKAFEMQQSNKARIATKQKKSVLSWIRGTFGITVLLGGTWVFGFLMAIPNPTVSRIAAYLFTVLNASQGIFLFIFNCVLNKKVRDVLSGHLPAWVSLSTLSSGTKDNLSTSKFKFNKKSDSLSFSDDSRRNSPQNLIEQIGRRELAPDY